MYTVDIFSSPSSSQQLITQLMMVEEVSFTLLERSEKLIVDTLEHEFVDSGDDSMMFLIKLAQWLTCSLILMTNGPMIHFIMKQVSKTFLDWLVFFDCWLCLREVLQNLKFQQLNLQENLLFLSTMKFFCNPSLSNILTLILLTDNSGHDEQVCRVCTVYSV